MGSDCPGSCAARAWRSSKSTDPTGSPGAINGKSDPLDAVEAARAAISGRASGAGKTKDGPVEAIRVLVVAKRSARQARVKAIVQMRHLGITAPDQLHSQLEGPNGPRPRHRKRQVPADQISRIR